MKDNYSVHFQRTIATPSSTNARSRLYQTPDSRQLRLGLTSPLFQTLSPGTPFSPPTTPLVTGRSFDTHTPLRPSIRPSVKQEGTNKQCLWRGRAMSLCVPWCVFSIALAQHHRHEPSTISPTQIIQPDWNSPLAPFSFFLVCLHATTPQIQQLPL